MPGGAVVPTLSLGTDLAAKIGLPVGGGVPAMETAPTRIMMTTLPEAGAIFAEAAPKHTGANDWGWGAGLLSVLGCTGGGRNLSSAAGPGEHLHADYKSSFRM